MRRAAYPPATPEPADDSLPENAERGATEAYYRDVAPFYDADLTARGDLAFWQAVAEAHRGRRVLELGAGTGRVTEVLAPAAGMLIALDLSPELLARARSRLGGFPHAHLLRGDMLTLAFREPFDLIVAANDPFSHIVDSAERDQVLAGVARSLAPGGQFVLDALWLSPAADGAVSACGGRVERRTRSLHGQRVGVVEHWERTSRREHRCNATYAYFRPGREPVVAEFAARDWTPIELLARLGRAGLAATDLWGDYCGSRWAAETSSQLIVCATPG
jgi:SAM-dependent methyltransferase